VVCAHLTAACQCSADSSLLAVCRFPGWQWRGVGRRPIGPALIIAAIVVGVGLMGYKSSQNMARKLRVRIDALASAEER
jgi:hypothetical protein